MSARILDGKAVAVVVRAEVARDAAALRAGGVEPGIAVILVGDDPASAVYVRNKTRAAREAGVAAFDHHLPADASAGDLLSLIRRLNSDDAVDGILLQLPLPRHLDPEAILDAIDPHKDVDGLHPDNLGRLALGRPRFVAATPKGCMRLLAEVECPLAGTQAVVIGRSSLVGKPMAMLLTNASATVTLCHSQSRDLPAHIAAADVVIVAAGRAGLVRGAWIKPGAVVLDVGTNRGADGKLVGDVEFAAAAERASVITPVPGGVGPMTIASVLANTVLACRLRRG